MGEPCRLEMNNPFAINCLEHELEEASVFARHKGLGLEVTAFAYASGLESGFEERIAWHAAMMDGLAWTSVHGPFLDLYATSSDPAIVAVCKRRHQVALQAAIELEASIYVAHLNSIPLIRNKAYRARFAEAAAAFWLPFADEAGKHGITVVLENLWEPGPEVHKAVVTQANHPHLKASFDNGHALVFSNVPARQWVEVLGCDLGHCHLHDNDGMYDQHKPIGEGVEDWSLLWAALETHAPQARVVLESDELTANQKSLRALRAFT